LVRPDMNTIDRLRNGQVKLGVARYEHYGKIEGWSGRVWCGQT
jgi:hypothetical protein